MSTPILHRADTRGFANHGWLQSYHTFSFSSYYNAHRMHFGVLRVLNDDTVAGGMGFGMHAHDNMEIISIPLSGNLEHKDSMGNVATIRQGDVQVMSAGTGIKHSEYNQNLEEAVRFLQIWVMPNKRNVEPRYQQLTLNPADRINQLQQIVSPDPDDAGVWIHQDAWFHLGSLDAGQKINHTVKKAGNGLYIFLLEGEVTIQDQILHRRDGVGITDASEVEITSNAQSEVLLMEVPMH